MGTSYVDGGRNDRCGREYGHELELWAQQEAHVIGQVVDVNVPGAVMQLVVAVQNRV